MEENSTSAGPERPAFSLSHSDVIATLASLAAGASFFWYRESHLGAPWLVHLPWNVIASVLVAVFSWGVLSSLFGRTRNPLLAMSIALQVLPATILAAAPFGFDHQSSWGLDAGHVFFLAFVYVVSLLAGLTIAAVTRHRRLVLAQLGLFAIAMLVVAFSAGIRGML